MSWITCLIGVAGKQSVRLTPRVVLFNRILSNKKAKTLRRSKMSSYRSFRHNRLVPKSFKISLRETKSKVSEDSQAW